MDQLLLMAKTLLQGARFASVEGRPALHVGYAGDARWVVFPLPEHGQVVKQVPSAQVRLLSAGEAARTIRAAKVSMTNFFEEALIALDCAPAEFDRKSAVQAVLALEESFQCIDP